MVLYILKRFHEEVLRDATALGGWLFTTLGVIVLLLIGQVQISIQLIVGLAAVYLIGIGVRKIYFKERPKKFKYKNWAEKIYASSFPSIHSMRIWVYVIIFSNFFWNGIVTVVLFAIGLIVAYSRLYLEKHDIIDVVVGSVIGIVVGALVTLI